MKYIATDIGDVLCDVDLPSFITTLTITGAVSSVVDGMRWLEEMHIAQDIGTISMQMAVDKLHVNMEAKRYIIDAWQHCVKPNKQIIDLMKKFQKHGYKIALLSNIGHEHAAIMRNILGLADCYEHFSCEVGARKPSKLFYQSFILDHPEFKNCPYIDDRAENNEAAKEYFKTISFSLKPFRTMLESKRFEPSLEWLENNIKTVAEEN